MEEESAINNLEEEMETEERNGERDKFKRERDSSLLSSEEQTETPVKRERFEEAPQLNRAGSEDKKFRERERDFQDGRERSFRRNDRFDRPRSPPRKRGRRDDEREPHGPIERDRYVPQKRFSYGGGGGREWRDPREDFRRQRAEMESILFDGPLKPFRTFMEVQQEILSNPEAEKRYGEYKNEHRRRQAKAFFERHKGEEWMKEKYDPHFVEQKLKDKLELSRKNAKAFLELLNGGNYDFNLTTEEEAPKLEIPKEEPPKEVQPGEGSGPPPLEEEGLLPEPQQPPPKQFPEKKPEGYETSTLFIKVIPPTCPRQEVVNLFSQIEGFRKLTVSDPNPIKHRTFNRYGWITYETPQQAEEALFKFQGHKILDFEIQLAWHKPNPEAKRNRIAPSMASDEQRISTDLYQCRQLIQHLDAEKGVLDNQIFSMDSFQTLTTVERLDRLITYLRKVHNFCYYCIEEFEDEDELMRKCGVKHLRSGGKSTPAEAEAANAWFISLDTKVKARLEKKEDFSQYSEHLLLQRKEQEFLTENTEKLADEKFRCGLCHKLFKGEEYVHKHVNLKHADKLEEAKKNGLEEQYFTNYLNDPKHIQVNPQSMAPPRRAPVTHTAGPYHPFSQPPINRGGPRKSIGAPPGRDRYAGHSREPPPRDHIRDHVKDHPRNPPRERSPPPGFPSDPRQIREYKDLDAPNDD